MSRCWKIGYVDYAQHGIMRCDLCLFLIPRKNEKIKAVLLQENLKPCQSRYVNRGQCHWKTLDFSSQPWTIDEIMNQFERYKVWTLQLRLDMMIIKNRTRVLLGKSNNNSTNDERHKSRDWHAHKQAYLDLVRAPAQCINQRPDNVRMSSSLACLSLSISKKFQLSPHS